LLADHESCHFVMRTSRQVVCCNAALSQPCANSLQLPQHHSLLLGSCQGHAGAALSQTYDRLVTHSTRAISFRLRRKAMVQIEYLHRPPTSHIDCSKDLQWLLLGSGNNQEPCLHGTSVEVHSATLNVLTRIETLRGHCRSPDLLGLCSSLANCTSATGQTLIQQLDFFMH